MSETTGRISPSDERALNAYFDGELNPISRWWLARRLARSAELRAELDEIRSLSERVAELGGDGPTVDLWDKIALSLPAADARRREGEVESDTEIGLGASPRFGRPFFAAAATAALAVAIVLGTIGDTPVPDTGVVRWLDAGASSVIVLEDPGEATIVWLLESPTEGAARGGMRESV